jgi:hypothetical protein
MVDSVQPASHATAFVGRSEASIRMTATIAHGERAHTTPSGSNWRKRSPIRRVSRLRGMRPDLGAVAAYAADVHALEWLLESIGSTEPDGGGRIRTSTG